MSNNILAVDDSPRLIAQDKIAPNTDVPLASLPPSLETAHPAERYVTKVDEPQETYGNHIKAQDAFSNKYQFAMNLMQSQPPPSHRTSSDHSEPKSHQHSSYQGQFCIISRYLCPPLQERGKPSVDACPCLAIQAVYLANYSSLCHFTSSFPSRHGCMHEWGLL